jgi:translation initiation factor 3 subunit H
MEKNGVLEITNCFPFPEVTASAQTDGQHETVANLAASAPRAKQNIAYGNEMIKFLREVNVDANNVGWYTVALIYDVSRSSQGTLNLRAYRLSPAFVTAYTEGKFTTETYVWAT